MLIALPNIKLHAKLLSGSQVAERDADIPIAKHTY
jgi:hypothetical protein